MLEKVKGQEKLKKVEKYLLSYILFSNSCPKTAWIKRAEIFFLFGFGSETGWPFLYYKFKLLNNGLLGWLYVYIRVGFQKIDFASIIIWTSILWRKVRDHELPLFARYTPMSTHIIMRQSTPIIIKIFISLLFWLFWFSRTAACCCCCCYCYYY